MTYLELCQEVARESGTISTIGLPASVTGQTGREARIVSWVDMAWNDIQTTRENWRWMRLNFVGQTVANVRNYQWDALGIASRFSHFVYQGEDGDNLISLYKTSEGEGNEGLLSFVEYNEFRRTILVGASEEQTGHPRLYTINDQGSLALHPIPDDVYTIRGRFHRAPQALVNDSDVPEMPAQFHRAITYRALMLLAQHDEAQLQYQFAASEFNRYMDRLEQHQLPRFTLAGALA